jgi:C-terminal processing protease CtpA/Prc
MVAALHDGHGWVSGGRQSARLAPPFHWDWVEKQAIITRVRAEEAEGLKPGDRILSIDGKPIAKAWDESVALISGATPHFVSYRGVTELGTCGAGMKTMDLEVEPYGAQLTPKKVQVACKPRDFSVKESYSEKRPPMTAELEPGIMYVDLDRITDAAWKEALPKLETAKGIVFDLRGYPNSVAIDALARLAKTQIRSARWNIPTPTKPDRMDLTFVESGWPVPPKQPMFPGRRAFLTDGRAISYAETVLGIVEHFKLAEIVGQPTAGTNGNVNPFRLPGGYTISWTGMKVLKHDNSQHHGIGIIPTVPVSRTRRGVAEEKDEILLRAIEVVKDGK